MPARASRSCEPPSRSACRMCWRCGCSSATAAVASPTPCVPSWSRSPRPRPALDSTRPGEQLPACGGWTTSGPSTSTWPPRSRLSDTEAATLAVLVVVGGGSTAAAELVGAHLASGRLAALAPGDADQHGARRADDGPRRRRGHLAGPAVGQRRRPAPGQDAADRLRVRQAGDRRPAPDAGRRPRPPRAPVARPSAGCGRCCGAGPSVTPSEPDALSRTWPTGPVAPRRPGAAAGDPGRGAAVRVVAHLGLHRAGRPTLPTTRHARSGRTGAGLGSRLARWSGQPDRGHHRGRAGAGGGAGPDPCSSSWDGMRPAALEGAAGARPGDLAGRPVPARARPQPAHRRRSRPPRSPGGASSGPEPRSLPPAPRGTCQGRPRTAVDDPGLLEELLDMHPEHPLLPAGLGSRAWSDG